MNRCAQIKGRDSSNVRPDGFCAVSKTQKDDQQKDSPAASWPAFRMACQAAANNHWDVIHIELKTAFLQGESCGKSRNIIREQPQESAQPWYTVARMKKPAYGLNDAPTRWFNVVDKQLRYWGCTPTRGDRCTYVLYSKHDRLAIRKVSKNITSDWHF